MVDPAEEKAFSKHRGDEQVFLGEGWKRQRTSRAFSTGSYMYVEAKQETVKPIPVILLNQFFLQDILSPLGLCSASALVVALLLDSKQSCEAVLRNSTRTCCTSFLFAHLFILNGNSFYVYITVIHNFPSKWISVVICLESSESIKKKKKRKSRDVCEHKAAGHRQAN